MRSKKPRPDVTINLPNTGNEPIPPGATIRAADRPLDPGGGPPGSGAGPRHATADPGSPDEEYEATETNDPLLEPPADDEEDGPPYAGPSGGAVGGTPAGKRSTGGHIKHGFNPGNNARGDSTIGAPPS